MDMNTKTTATKPASSPKADAPQAFREMAEKGTTQANEAYEKMSAATTEAADLIKNSYSIVVKGAQDYNNKFIEFTQANTNATFDFYGELMTVKSFSEVVELSTAHARKQFETITAQTKDLTALAQKVATETAEPLKGSVTKAFQKVG